MKIHLIAIGGAVMHNLALALHNLGHEVSGSDDEINSPSRERLLQKGLLPDSFGWFPERITADIDLVILGMHARKDNPELIRAVELGLPVKSFPEYVGECYAGKTKVAIAGSHGKTTTTSMIAHILKQNNRKFDYLIGSNIEGFDTMVSITDAPIAILEADEYLSSPLDSRSKFLHYFPDIAVITGIAWDHINVFPEFEQYLETFRKFIRTIPDEGTLIYYKHDIHLYSILQEKFAVKNIISYDACKHNIATDGEIVILDSIGTNYPVRFFGKHNLENFQAAYLVCRQLGLSEEEILRAAGSFTGAGKRMELICSNSHFAAYLDFAHAPSKLKSTVDAIGMRYPRFRKIAIYELHTFSSLNADFLKEYRHCMNNADVKVVFYSKHTLEMKKLQMIEPEDVIKAFDEDNMHVFTDKEELMKFINMQSKIDTVLLWMSSGNFDGLDVRNISKSFA